MVRGLINLVLFLCLLHGAVVLCGTFLLLRVQQQVSVEPHTVSIAEFVQTGRGDNGHVELTGVYFGTPMIETHLDKRRAAWLPLYPAPAADKAAPPPVVLKLAHDLDEASLAEFVKRTSVTAIVCGGMPAWTPWDVRLPARFSKEYPAKTLPIVLAQPEVRFLDWSWGPDVVFDRNTQTAAWALGGVLACLGLFGLLWMGSASAAAAPAVTDKAALAAEQPLSRHAFDQAAFAKRGFLICLFCGGLIAFCLLLMFAGLTLLLRQRETGYIVVGMSAFLILINVFLIWSHFAYRTQGVAAIEVCPGGLRWLKTADSPTQVAGWGEVADVSLNHLSPYPWRHELTITLQSGQSLKLAAFSLTDYARFAELVSTGFKQRGLVSKSLAGFMPK
jgi:hypothetical protein